MRYEYKYIVEESKLKSVRNMIMPFVDVDAFAESDGQNQYTVRSIYLDTPKYDYYFEKVDGIKNRKKLRIRGYNIEASDNTVFLEIKRKFDIPIVKDRAPVKFADVNEIFRTGRLNGFVQPDKRFPLAKEHAKKFFFQVHRKNLRPTVLVIYEREAYFGKFDDTVRITFDKNLRSIAYPHLQDLYSEDKAIRSLNKLFILEVKFNKFFPAYLSPIIAHHGLLRESASKYVISMDAHKIANRFQKSTLYTNSNWFN